MAGHNGLLILGDWGTSVNRLYLCSWSQNALVIIARAEGPGTKNSPDCETAFFSLASPWIAEHGPIPTYLIGTVGSNLGWKKVDYVVCPCDHSQSLATALRFSVRGIDFVIFPGLSCVNIHGLPDSMRGEETQVFGFLAQQSSSAVMAPESQLVCLPGTHTKWVQVENSIVTRFLTSPIGELFEVLCLHSVLLKSATLNDWDDEGFMQGLKLASKSSSSLLHTLFATRSQQVINDYSNAKAAGFLSGLLIGSDIKSAIRSFDPFSHVVLIGSSKVNSLYQLAFKHHHISTEVYSSEWATTHGIITIASKEWSADE